jgi:hypothetical protein
MQQNQLHSTTDCSNRRRNSMNHIRSTVTEYSIQIQDKRGRRNDHSRRNCYSEADTLSPPHCMSSPLRLRSLLSYSNLKGEAIGLPPPLI